MTDDERGDWLHECRRDERLDRIVELEAEVERLTRERDAAIVRADDLRSELDGYEGCCWACEPVGIENERLRAELAQLKQEARLWEEGAAAAEQEREDMRAVMERRTRRGTGPACTASKTHKPGLHAPTWPRFVVCATWA